MTVKLERKSAKHNGSPIYRFAEIGKVMLGIKKEDSHWAAYRIKTSEPSRSSDFISPAVVSAKTLSQMRALIAKKI